MSKENDGLINWVEPNKLGFLPKDIEDDTLSILLRLLIGKVKEDHARHQYKKELKNYGPDIIEIINFAKENGYKYKKVTETKYSKRYQALPSSLNNVEEEYEINMNDIPSIVENINKEDENNEI
ncbi:MAG: hypothetical protein ACOCUI_02000 [bacterium]